MVYLLLYSIAFRHGSLVRLNWFLESVIGQNQWTEVSVLTLQFSTFRRHSTVFLTVVCLVNSANMVCDTVQNWLHSFLSDQYQIVVVNSAQSSWLRLIRHSPRYRFGSTRACQQYISQGYQNSQLHTSQCVLLSS